jgi:hypothetical protein
VPGALDVPCPVAAQVAAGARALDVAGQRGNEIIFGASSSAFRTVAPVVAVEVGRAERY